MKKKKLNIISAISSVVLIFILIIQLDFCRRVKGFDIHRNPNTKSCDIFLFREVIKPSQYLLHIHINKNLEKEFNQINWSDNSVITRWKYMVFVTGLDQYFYYRNKIRLSLSRAQLQVYLC